MKPVSFRWFYSLVHNPLCTLTANLNSLSPDSNVGFSIGEVFDSICAYESCTNYSDGASIVFFSNLLNIHSKKA